LTVGSLTTSKVGTLHLKSDDDLDCKILFDENGYASKPWYFGTMSTNNHGIKIGYGSSTVGSGTVMCLINSGGMEFPNGDVTFSSSSSQSFTKEGSAGNLNFRTNATAKEITFRPNLIEAVQYVAHDGTTCKAHVLAGHNMVVGGAARAIDATDGFLYIPTINNAGVTPTGDVRDYSDTKAFCYGTIDLGDGDEPCLWVNTNSETGWYYALLTQG